MIRILIVEDDENISKMLAATLSIGDYEYDRCADGEEAVQTILNGTYDLIFRHLMMQQQLTLHLMQMASMLEKR